MSITNSLPRLGTRRPRGTETPRRAPIAATSFDDYAIGRELEGARIRHGRMTNRERNSGVVLVLARVDGMPAARAERIGAARTGLRRGGVDLIGLRLRDDRHQPAEHMASADVHVEE